MRISLLSAGVWWAAFTVIPFLGLRDRAPVGAATPSPARWSGSPSASWRPPCAHLRGYPQTLLFLLAYLFFNDGIQTVISASSVYGDQQLGFSSAQLIITILLVQFVAFGGALLFGRLAAALRRLAGRSWAAWCCGPGS